MKTEEYPWNKLSKLTLEVLRLWPYEVNEDLKVFTNKALLAGYYEGFERCREMVLKLFPKFVTTLGWEDLKIAIMQLKSEESK